MDTKQDYHKYKAADMPEIRKIRTKLIESYKLKRKNESDRAEVISKAIIKDINYKKLGISDSNSYLTEPLNEAIEAWRHSLKDMIDNLLFDESLRLYYQEETSASSPEIFNAAETMAQKYFQRSLKARRHQKRPKKSSAATRTPHPQSLDKNISATPITRTPPSPIIDNSKPPTPIHHQQPEHLHLDLPLDWSKPMISTDWSKSPKMNTQETSPKVRKAPRQRTPKPHELTSLTSIDTTIKAPRNTIRPSKPTIQSNIKSHFQTRKSTKPRHQQSLAPSSTKPSFIF